MSTNQNTELKRRRITKACDFCHRRGRKCRPADGDSGPCLTCVDHGVVCTSNRVPARRGVKPRKSQPSSIRSEWTLDVTRHGPRPVIQALIDIFFQDVYPIICTIHEESFRKQWDEHCMPDGQASYARLLAMCALSAQRITTGASPAPAEVTKDISVPIYLDDALTAISRNHQELDHLHSLQAVHLLCVTAMEAGHAPLYHQLMGHYHTIVANHGLADETRWPSNILPLEIEEQRRLFWHMYRLEVHTALILGHVIRLPEIQIAVEYPNDIYFDPDLKDDSASTEWLTGWNFVTDLYRGLEYTLIHFRARRHRAASTHRTELITSRFGSENERSELIEQLKMKYEKLPMRFKEGTEMTADVGRNRCVYQTANIICTYQLLKMLSYASGKVKFQDACDTVLQLVEGISTIPVSFIRSMSLAMVQELSGFGHLLSSFIGKDLSISEYRHLSTVMLCMSELLECLTSSISAAHEAAEKLKKYVDRIESQLNVMKSSAKPSAPVVDLDQDMVPSTIEMAFPLDFFEQMEWAGLFTQSMDQQLFDQTFPSFSAF